MAKLQVQSSNDWSPQFHALLSSPLGEELIRTLTEDLHASIIQDAERADTLERGYGLLKQGSGVMLALNHLKMRGSVSPEDEGSQGIK